MTLIKAAQVIVDSPLMQTDKPYTYKVPKEFAHLIKVGIRVHVPFGKGNRLIQGIVVNLLSNIEEEVNLKSIVEMLDFEPVLNQEQLQLADAIRKTTYSYKISLLKAMLPNLLNSSYDKLLYPTANISNDVRERYFGRDSTISFSALSLKDQRQVMSYVQSNQIEVKYTASGRNTSKYESYYHVDYDALEQVEISKRAHKRLELRDYLLKHPEEGQLTVLRKNYSQTVVKYFIEQGLISVEKRESNRASKYFTDIAKTNPLVLNHEQKKAYETIVRTMGQSSETFLLEGITGSGKTEVYLQIIEKAIALGKTAIVLVPEISLTPMMTNRFIARFGQKVAIMHSGLSDGEKYDEWRKIKKGEASVVVGARSAIFAPLEKIGVIIIDEEHESSYKQDSSPRYHARDVALLRSIYHKASLVLGSATPSLESRSRAGKGVYHFLQLRHRANPHAKLPEIDLVNIRDYIGSNSTSNYTPILLDKIREKIQKSEQVVLLLNRRGYSNFAMCRDCGYVDTCPNCDISLTLHLDTRTMKCHYCNYVKGIPQTCPNCQAESMSYYGSGTQKAVEELQAEIPEAKILRMDVDTTRKKGAHERILSQFENHQADILLGTQMVAKGLDFPEVTLVGVLNADTALHFPDFRSSERTFQLLTQVAGRAGRADKKGEVVIQTYNPDHYAIKLAKEQDYEDFYRHEMMIRRKLGYPPYYFTVGITISHRKEDEAIKKAYEFSDLLKQNLSSNSRILGPSPKPIARTQNLYHYQLMIKYRFEEQLPLVLNHILSLTQARENKDFRVIIDNEPQNFM